MDTPGTEVSDPYLHPLLPVTRPSLPPYVELVGVGLVETVSVPPKNGDILEERPEPEPSQLRDSTNTSSFCELVSVPCALWTLVGDFR